METTKQDNQTAEAIIWLDEEEAEDQSKWSDEELQQFARMTGETPERIGQLLTGCPDFSSVDQIAGWLADKIEKLRRNQEALDRLKSKFE